MGWRNHFLELLIDTQQPWIPKSRQYRGVDRRTSQAQCLQIKHNENGYNNKDGFPPQYSMITCCHFLEYLILEIVTIAVMVSDGWAGNGDDKQLSLSSPVQCCVVAANLTS